MNRIQNCPEKMPGPVGNTIVQINNYGLEICSNRYELKKEQQHELGVIVSAWGSEQNEWNGKQKNDPFWVWKNE